MRIGGRLMADPRFLRWSLLLALALRLGFGVWNLHHNRAFFAQEEARSCTQQEAGEVPFLSTFGFEVSNVACSLACKGEGFANPFGGDTGPTAWVSPGIVAFYALPFKLLGCYSLPSVALIFALALVLSLLSTGFVFAIARILLDDVRLANLSALAFSLLSYDAYLFLVPSQLDLNVYSFLLLSLVLCFLKYHCSPSPRRLLFFAVLTAVATLFQPTLLLCAVLSLVFHLFIHPTGRLVSVASWLAVLAILVCPWILYQRYAVGGWFFVKSNGAFELDFGNRGEVGGAPRGEAFQRYHPSQSETEYWKYASLGEVEYMASKSASFHSSFHPASYLRACATRFLHYYFLYQPQPYDRPGAKLILKHLLSIVPGATLIAYLVLSHRARRRLDLLFYLYLGSYSLPSVLLVFMERHAYPVMPLVLICLVGLLGQVVGVGPKEVGSV